MADFVNFTQVVLDVMFAKKRDIEPEVFTETTLNALTLSDTLFHTTAHDVAASEFFLLGFDVRHKAMTIAVTQKSTVTTAAFRDENARWENTRRVELNGFHVAQCRNTRFESKSSARAFANLSVRCHAEKLASAACGNRCGFGNIGEKFAVNQVANNRTITTLAIVNQRQGFNTFNNRNVLSDNAVANGVKHGVTCAVGDEARTPLLRTTEVTLTD